MTSSAKEAGDRSYREGRYTEAIASYQRVISEGGAEPHKVFANMCACHLQLGQLQSALSDAEACIRIKPEWVKGYLRKGSCLVRLGRKADALAAYRQVLTLERGNIEAADAIRSLQSSPQPSGPPSGGWDFGRVISAGSAYLGQCAVRAAEWWRHLDDSTKYMGLAAVIGFLVYYLFLRPSGYYGSSYYDDYSSGGGLSWTAWGAVMLAAYKVPPMLPNVFGQYALPFFGMNISTFAWLVNMMTQNRGRRSSSMFGNRYGAGRRFY